MRLDVIASLRLEAVRRDNGYAFRANSAPVQTGVTTPTQELPSRALVFY